MGFSQTLILALRPRLLSPGAVFFASTRCLEEKL